MTREEWLTELVGEICNGFSLTLGDPRKITCGWTSSGARKRKVRPVVELIHKDYSASKTYELFVSPEVADPNTFFDPLVHLLVKMSTGEFGKLRKQTRYIERQIGWHEMFRYQSNAYREMKDAVLVDMSAKHGEYPHAEIHLADGSSSATKNPLKKLICPSCGIIMRATDIHIDVGVPFCQCGARFNKA